MAPVETCRRALIAVLRSGKYRQGKELLRPTEDTFCCLGVACDLVDPEGWKYDREALNGGGAWLHQGMHSLPSTEVNKLYGELLDPFYFPELAISADGMNDEGHTFLEISGALEAHWFPAEEGDEKNDLEGI